MLEKAGIDAVRFLKPLDYQCEFLNSFSVNFDEF